MVYHSIRPEQSQHLSMFGFETVSENDEFLCVHSFSRGTEIIQKSNPMIWFDDPLEADQLK